MKTKLTWLIMGAAFAACDGEPSRAGNAPGLGSESADDEDAPPEGGTADPESDSAETDDDDDVPPDEPVPEGFPEPGQSGPEVPFDPTKLAEVCARGNGDRVAAALCGDVQVSSMQDLFEALSFEEPFFAMTANSSSLVGRDVSALNPRLIVGEAAGTSAAVSDEAPSTQQLEAMQAGLMAYGFVRGEQLVELMAHDPNTDELNFYLLMFEQDCNASAQGCQVSDLVTPAVESNWTRWTLYQDRDLSNTSLDCNVCHQPLGPDTPKIPRLQEVRNSWTHWFPVRPSNQGGGWSSGGGGGTRGLDPGSDDHGTRSSTELWALFESMHGGDERYGGIELDAIRDEAAGPDIETFVRAWLLAQELPQTLQLPVSDFVEANDFFLDSASMEREGAASSWSEEYERVAAGERLPLPSYRIDITSSLTRDEVVETYRAVSDGSLPSTELLHPSAAIGYSAMEEMSLVPRQDADAREILTHLCARCHNSRLDPSVSRARFDATMLSNLSPSQKAIIADRIQRSEGDAKLMPPHRFGTMPPWAVSRVLEWLEP